MHRRRQRSLAAGAVAAGAALVLGAAPGLAGSSIPAVDEIRSSNNVERVGSAERTEPLDGFNSDLAFSGDYAFQGNYNGFTVWDISTPEAPERAAEVLCPGAQNDVTVSGDVLVLSTDSRRSDDTCQSGAAPRPEDEDDVVAEEDYWEGVKVFDVSDPTAPEYVSSVRTDCGSHTHTLVPGDADTDYVYVSSYDLNESYEGCQPPHDKISIVEIPRDSPEDAFLAAEPVVFPDGGNPGDPPGTPFVDRTRATAGCHDITAFPADDLAAGACMGDGVLWDISDRLAPREIHRVQDDENFAFWHSATFNNTGDKVVFTDELGGGGAATCVADIPDTRGADGIYDIEGSGDDRELVFQSYYKIPRLNSETENCVAHNGSLIPVEGKDIMVQSWYQGGVSVWDFTDSENPQELGYWERGPLSEEELILGGSWSAYWYNGHVYSSDIVKGLDVLEIRDREVAKAQGVKFDELNVQTQPVYSGRGYRQGGDR